MNTYWRNLLTYLVSIPTAFLCCSLMRNQFKHSFRRTLITVMAVLLATIPVAAWADTYTSMDSGLIILLLLIACFVPYHISVRSHFSKAIAIFFYVVSITTLVSSVCTGIDALFNPTAGQNDITVLFIILHLILTTGTVALLNIPFSRQVVKLIDRMDIPAVWYATIPTSIVCIFVSMTMMPAEYSVFLVNHTIGTYFTAILLFVLSFIALTFSFYRVSTTILYAARAEERTRFLEMQKSQFDSQQRYMEETAAARHDFRQTIYTLRGLLQEEDYNSLNEYFEEFYGSLPENDITRFCINRPLNALLNYYAASARRSGIDLRLVIDPFEDINVSDVDLCTVVGNILDNAVAACMPLDVKDRFVQLSIVDEGGVNLFIVGSNSFDGTVRRRNNQYLSVKRDGTGIGLSSVTHIAESYGGSAEFSNDGSVFYSNVMIPLSNIKAASDD